MARRGSRYAVRATDDVVVTITKIRVQLLRFGAENIQIVDDPARQQGGIRFRLAFRRKLFRLMNNTKSRCLLLVY